MPLYYQINSSPTHGQWSWCQSASGYIMFYGFEYILLMTWDWSSCGTWFVKNDVHTGMLLTRQEAHYAFFFANVLCIMVYMYLGILLSSMKGDIIGYMNEFLINTTDIEALLSGSDSNPMCKSLLVGQYFLCRPVILRFNRIYPFTSWCVILPIYFYCKAPMSLKS